MVTLAANLSSSSTILVSDTVVPASLDIGELIRIDDELLSYQGLVGTRIQRIAAKHWQVRRGEKATISTSHTSGTAIFATVPAILTGTGIAQPDPFADGPENPNIPTSDQKAALDAASPALDGSHPPLTAPGLRWRQIASIGFAEWNAAYAGSGIIDIAVIPTGAWLHDLIVLVSDNWNDSGAPTGAKIGWTADSTAHRLSAGPIAFQPNEWPGVVTGNPDFLNKTVWQANGVSPQYGPPSLVLDADTAGPLQFYEMGGNGDASAGSIDVWALIQDA